MSSGLINFYSNIELFMIVAVRFFGFFVIVPIFGGSNIPTMVRVSLSVFCAAITISTGNVNYVLENYTFIYYVSVLVGEFFIGLIIGFVVYFLLSVFYYAGQMIDYQIGFSMVSVYDPVTQLQVPVAGNLLYLTICALFISIGGDHVLFGAMFYSFDQIPIHQAAFFNGGTFETVSDMVVAFFTVGYKVAMPVVGLILVLDVALGLLTKVAPQMNIFSVGMAVKVLMGLIILFLTAPLFIEMRDLAYSEMLKYVSLIIEEMRP